MENPTPSEIRLVDRRLKRLFGEPRRAHRDPVAQLVITMLSQATTDVQTDRSFAELRRRFPTWEQVRDAPAAEIAAAIHSSGLARQKAPRIKKALQHITCARGRIELAFLKRLPPAEAWEWLTAISGVGPKTTAIVLLFSFGMPFFPVDTHIHRVTQRLGWTPPTAGADKAHDILSALVPTELYFRLHLNLIEHGRATCHARKPECDKCPLVDLCDYYRQTGGVDRTDS